MKKPKYVDLTSSQLLRAAIDELLGKENDLTVNIHGKKYVTVASRIAIARKHFGTRIALQTNIEENTERRVVMRTQVFVDGELVSVGTAEEFRGTSNINRTSALENCETSSVGRALGLLGLTNDAIASAEEMQQVQNVEGNRSQNISTISASAVINIDELKKRFDNASHVEGLKAIVSEPDIRDYLNDLKGRNLSEFKIITNYYNKQQKQLLKGKNNGEKK